MPQQNRATGIGSPIVLNDCCAGHCMCSHRSYRFGSRFDCFVDLCCLYHDACRFGYYVHYASRFGYYVHYASRFGYYFGYYVHYVFHFGYYVHDASRFAYYDH
eukprot:GEMP01052963.1.p2 GENE.GEMP01052963.1~~GEMP01052963.1.p2  ORF type:complete len:103 (-),score=11.53 GEMP01052963.1:21-329(-)